jgi:hypothetical protein
MPTLVEILNGVMPANMAAIRVDVVPGSTSRHSARQPKTSCLHEGIGLHRWLLDFLSELDW